MYITPKVNNLLLQEPQMKQHTAPVIIVHMWANLGIGSKAVLSGRFALALEPNTILWDIFWAPLGHPLESLGRHVKCTPQKDLESRPGKIKNHYKAVNCHQCSHVAKSCEWIGKYSLAWESLGTPLEITAIIA